MTKISWRHHYLPVFYLKGFTKKSNKFKIYDVQNKRFVKDGKDFSPESYFFKKNDNTISIGDYSDDSLESKYYKKFDNDVAKLINKINSEDHSTRHGVDENDMPALNHFVSLMYWRLPHKREELKKIIKNNDLNSLGVSMVDELGISDPEIEEKFKNSEIFLKGYKFHNSLMDSTRGYNYNCRTPYTIIESSNELPFLCSDNPVIFEKQNPEVYKDDYLFPLSGTRLFMKTDRREDFPPLLRMMVDTLIFKQAVKYVSCTDEKHINILEENFERFNITVEGLKEDIFKRIKVT
ncbi:DUF4238 domain-containing protein [Aquimarina rubra]|uniref:DUF4238 domain-containing protein n=1 Tax=Aquimarina rubra TaxID=1920033 RepID=A0ABW5LB26_9FLAO